MKFKTKTKTKTASIWSLAALSVVVVLQIIATTGALRRSNIKTHDGTLPVALKNSYGFNSQQIDGRKARVLVWNRYVEWEPTKSSTLKDLMASNAGTIGNNVWAYAGTYAIFDTTQVELVSMWPANPELRREDFDVHMIPVANIIWPVGNHNLTYFQDYDEHLDWIKQVHAILEKTDRPAFMYGLGVQGYESIGKSKSMHQDLGDSYEWERSPREYSLHAEYIRLLASVSRRSPVIGVRGNFTREVCHDYGFDTAVALGCPSLFLNPHEELGAALERLITTLPTNPRLVIMLPARYGIEFFRFYFNQLNRHPDNVIILQGSTDYGFLKRAEAELNTSVPEHRLKFFPDYPTWSKFLCDFDAILGSRIHGSMIGLSCPVPVVLIPTDLRTDELGRNMRIPVVQPNHTLFTEHDYDKISMHRLFDAAGFSGEAFDTNRRVVAKQYSAILEAMGVPPSNAVRTLASSNLL